MMLRVRTGIAGRMTVRHLTIALLALVTTYVAGLYALSRPMVDFSVYWTAAHLFVGYQNPYSFSDVLQIQRGLGWDGPLPIILLCPPWTLGLIAPLGWAHSYVAAWLAWFGLLAAALAISSRLLMDLYFQDLKIDEISHPPAYRYLFAFTFYPCLLGLKFTQIALLLLLGVAGFLYFESKRPVLAGALWCLTLIKPQSLWLIWVVLILRSWRQRQVKILLSSAATLAVFIGIALSIDPHAFREYWELMKSPFPRLVLSGMLGGVRREFEPHDTYWLQFVPPLFGMPWLMMYWRKHRDSWNWIDRMPALITACLVTSAYEFVSDQTLLIVPVIALAAAAAREAGQLPIKLVALYTALNAAVLLIAINSTQWAVVPAPVFLAALLYHRSRSRFVSDVPDRLATNHNKM